MRERHQILEPIVHATVMVFLMGSVAVSQTTWSVTAVPRITSSSDSVVSLHFTGVMKTLKNVHIYSSTLQEATSGRIIGADSLRVCGNNDRSCASPTIDPTNPPVSLILRGLRDRIGVFSGAVYFAADSAVSAPLTLSISLTGWTYKSLGAFALVFGVLLSWFFTIGLRRKTLRDQGRLAAARVRERVPVLQNRATALLNAIGKTMSDMPKLDAALDAVNAALSDANVNTLLPNPIPNPLFDAQMTLDQLANLIADQTKILAVVEVALERGFAVGLIIVHARKDAIVKMLPDLDVIAANSTPETVLASVEAWLVKVRGELSAAQEAFIVPAAGSARPAGGQVTARTLELRVQQESLAAWLVWALLTSLVGYFAIVESNPGFGLPIDYLKAFAWGLGVTITGTTLQQLTPATVSTALTVSIPK